MVEVNDIVQIDPSMDIFGGCLAVVSEVKANGRLLVYVQNADAEGQAYIFVNPGKYEATGGRAVWAPQ